MTERHRSPQFPSYDRHIVLPGFGEDGQAALARARILVVGVGGLGCSAAMHLTCMGTGVVGLMDPDIVEASNLHRQVLYGPADIGKSKVRQAAERLSTLNPGTVFRTHQADVASHGATREFADYDIVVDGTDNVLAHHAVSQAARRTGKPVILGAVHQYEGRVTVLQPEGPCYACINPGPPSPSDGCREAGVLGSIPGVVGALQATEAVRWVAGLKPSLAGRMLIIDGRSMHVHEMSLAGLAACSHAPNEMPRGDTAGAPLAPVEITPNELARVLANGNAPLLLDVRTPEEARRGQIPGSRLLPLDQLEADAATLPAKQAYVAYCETGTRSSQAAAALRARGYTCASLAGGWRAWTRSQEMTPVVLLNGG